MRNFESDFDDCDNLDNIAVAISNGSQENVYIYEEYSNEEIDLSYEALSSSDLISNIGVFFEKNAMNEHLATINLLGNLGHSDLFMYYCIVMDCDFINKEIDNNEEATKIITPEQYINEKENLKEKVFDFSIEVDKSKIAVILRILKYFKNKEFRILSNTFYMDGADFIIALSLKSVIGYNLRLNIHLNCISSSEAVVLNGEFKKIFNMGDNNE